MRFLSGRGRCRGGVHSAAYGAQCRLWALSQGFTLGYFHLLPPGANSEGGVCASPPIEQKALDGWGTVLERRQRFCLGCEEAGVLGDADHGEDFGEMGGEAVGIDLLAGVRGFNEQLDHQRDAA